MSSDNYVTRDLFEERTDNMTASLNKIEQHVACIPEIKRRVDDHEKFISGFKKIGLRILIALAASAIFGGGGYAIITDIAAKHIP